MLTSPRVAFLASLPALDWSAFLAGPDPCRKRALASPHLTSSQWAILRPLFLLAIERGAGARRIESAIAGLFGVDERSPFVGTCIEEWRLCVRIGIALERWHLFMDNPASARLQPFAQWRTLQVPGRCAHDALEGRVIPHGAELMRRCFPPLSEICMCSLAPVNLARARREASSFTHLLEEEVCHLVAPLWAGACAPVLASDAECSEVLEQGEAILATAGIVWRKRPGFGAGLASRPAG